jgi:hypothetical protein
MSWYLPFLTDPPVPPPIPSDGADPAANQWPDWKTITAVIGAVTGSYGAINSYLVRRDNRWKRAAKQLPTVRPALLALRDAIAEAEANNRSVTSLRDAALRSHLEVLQESRSRIADRRLTAALGEVDTAYTAVLALADAGAVHRRNAVLDRSAEAVHEALDRVTEIERKALP